MPPLELQTPGVYVQEVPSGAQPIQQASTSTTAFVGYTLKGPLNEAVLIDSLSSFEKTFGGLSPNALVARSISMFFQNGGKRAWVVRVDAPDVGEDDDQAAGAGDGDGEDESVAIRKTLIGTAEHKSGIHALEDVEDFDLLCIPRMATLNPPKAAKLIQECLAYCRRRRAFLIVDPPLAIDTVKAMVKWKSKHSLNESHGAVYFPPVLADADDGVSLDAGPYPASGAIAGVYARTDATRGVWKAPAGIEAGLNDISGLAPTLTDEDSGELNPRGINALREFPSTGNVIWGSRTLAGDDLMGSEWKYVNVRRLAILIRKSIETSIGWVVFEPNDQPLWSSLQSDVEAFLNSLFNNGALQGETPDEAFFVRCDRSTTTPADIKAGVVNIVVGFAPLKPAEFIIIKIRQKALVPDA